MSSLWFLTPRSTQQCTPCRSSLGTYHLARGRVRVSPFGVVRMRSNWFADSEGSFPAAPRTPGHRLFLFIHFFSCSPLRSRRTVARHRPRPKGRAPAWTGDSKSNPGRHGTVSRSCPCPRSLPGVGVSLDGAPSWGFHDTLTRVRVVSRRERVQMTDFEDLFPITVAFFGVLDVRRPVPVFTTLHGHLPQVPVSCRSLAVFCSMLTRCARRPPVILTSFGGSWRDVYVVSLRAVSPCPMACR
jgi:hypothetical protein